MSKDFGGDALKIRTASAARLKSVLGKRSPKAGEPGYRAFEDLALFLALIPDLSEWTDTDNEKLAMIIRAKTGGDESRYAKLLQRHKKLRAAIIKLGEIPPGP
jgi:hypothetical protein